MLDGPTDKSRLKHDSKHAKQSYFCFRICKPSKIFSKIGFKLILYKHTSKSSEMYEVRITSKILGQHVLEKVKGLLLIILVLELMDVNVNFVLN